MLKTLDSGIEEFLSDFLRMSNSFHVNFRLIKAAPALLRQVILNYYYLPEELKKKPSTGKKHQKLIEDATGMKIKDVMKEIKNNNNKSR